MLENITSFPITLVIKVEIYTCATANYSRRYGSYIKAENKASKGEIAVTVDRATRLGAKEESHRMDGLWRQQPAKSST